MSTVLDSIKELIAKVPNLEQVVAQARQQAAVKPVADVAYVYNGFGDIRLEYLGRYHYDFEFGKVTKIETIHEHMEVNAERSTGRELVYDVMPLKGENIARELIEGRGYGRKGMAIFFNNTGIPPRELKEKADAEGEQCARTSIENFKTARDKARSGIAGFKMKPDARIYNWMKKYSPDDDMFAEQHRKSNASELTAASLDTLTKLMGVVLQRQADAAASVPPPVEAPVVEEPKPEGYPKMRKPLEKAEQLAARQAKFMEEWNRKQAEVAQAPVTTETEKGE
jgi:hypothetical protein